jgi:hypothetical protein
LKKNLVLSKINPSKNPYFFNHQNVYQKKIKTGKVRDVVFYSVVGKKVYVFSAWG